MKQKTFTLTVGVVFSIIAVLHVLRLLFGWEAVIGGWSTPLWVSWVAITVSGYLGYTAFKLQKMVSCYLDSGDEETVKEIPPSKEYKYLTARLQYLNEKIIQSFTLFIKLATTIVGGAFYLRLNLPNDAQMRMFFSQAVELLLVVVSLSMILLILNNLFAWQECQANLSKKYKGIKKAKGMRWWFSEAVMCLLIAGTSWGFHCYNPLRH